MYTEQRGYLDHPHGMTKDGVRELTVDLHERLSCSMPLVVSGGPDGFEVHQYHVCCLIFLVVVVPDL